MKLRRYLSMILAVLAALMAGCATTQMKTATTKGQFETVFEAARQAAIENGYAITSADPTSGFISASQYAVGGPGRQVRLNVKVTKGPPVSVEVSVVPPPGTIGDTEGIATKVLQSIKSRVPDLVW